MKTNDGANVQKVATVAPNIAHEYDPCVVHPAMNPTNVLTMTSGPGVVSPSARPAIMSFVVSQPK